MTVELNARQLQLIRFAVANEGNKLRSESNRHKAQRNLSQAAKDERLANEFLAVETYLKEATK